MPESKTMLACAHAKRSTGGGGVMTSRSTSSASLSGLTTNIGIVLGIQHRWQQHDFRAQRRRLAFPHSAPDLPQDFLNLGRGLRLGGDDGHGKFRKRRFERRLLPGRGTAKLLPEILDAGVVSTLNASTQPGGGIAK